MDTTHGLNRMAEGHEEPHAVTEALPHHKVPYYGVFGLLVALTAVTVSVAFLDIHNEMAKVLLALTIAAIKASAVALFFMHLKFEGKLIYLILIVPLLLCVLLIVALIPDIVYALPFNRMAPLPGASGH
jgi:cytochrome c oxidase subunit 4